MSKGTIFLLPLFASLLFGKGGREYPCYLIDAQPILDGKAEEKVWATVPEATGFYILGGEKFALEKQTYFRAGWREDALYIYLICEEPAMDKVSSKLKDGEELYREDSVELFFFPGGAPHYLHLVVNPIGSRWNEIDASGQPGAPWDWQAKAHIGKDFWAVEVRIPFEVLGEKPKEGECWLFNIGRNIYTGPSSEHFTCWPPLRSGFHELRNFAQFIFKGQVPTASEKERIEEEINRSFSNFLQGKIKEFREELARNSSGYEEAIAYGLEREELRGEAIYLKEGWESLNLLSAQEKPSLQSLRSFLLRYPTLTQRFKEFHYKVLLEKLFE